MTKKTSARKLGPDFLKILATVFVIVIHHKNDFKNVMFVKQLYLFYIILFVISLLTGLAMTQNAYRNGKNKNECMLKFLVVPGCYFSLLLLRRFAVAIFMLVSGYLLTKTLQKTDKPIKEWYTRKNIIPRIVRFYLPLIPVFVVGLIYKIIVKNYEYSLIEVLLRFPLGGFKPGSYYITILAEMVLIVPCIYIMIKRYMSKGVFLIIVLTLIYDAACTFLGMNDILYKFLVFRFMPHIALGIYGCMADFKKDKKFNITVFSIGLVYAVVFIYTNALPTVMFFQWRDASLFIAMFLYAPVMWFIDYTKDMSYSNSRLSDFGLTFANATYHIFMIQLLYYTTFGYELNEYINNYMITVPVNVLITVPLGILYYKLYNPVEKKTMTKLNSLLK